MKAYRRYVREQVTRDPRLAQDVADTRAEVRLPVMIARLREALGWSPRDLAKAMGGKQPQIARIEKGGQMPTTETRWCLADALNAEVVIGPHQSLEIRAA